MKDKVPSTFGPELVIFTDLDGTLLDHHTYSWENARPALEFCKMLGVPVIICSSKTKAEIEHIKRQIGNDHPFISENGGGAHIPVSLFPPPDLSYAGLFWVLKLGVSHSTLRRTLEKIRDETQVEIVGLSDMNDEELAGLTGLEGDALHRARLREFDEPFTIRNETPKKASRVCEAIQKSGFIYTRGGRFHHITGNNDKGRALKKIMELYKSLNEDVKSAALGDSLNDFPMLKAADIPILVKKFNGTHDPMIKAALRNCTPARGAQKMASLLVMAGGIGPQGWNEEVIQLLRQIHPQ